MNEYIAALADRSEIRVMMVCLGNICRSPMAAAALHNRTQQITKPKYLVSSSGTGSWHVGEGPNLKSKKVWEAVGYQYEHTAQQFNSAMFENQDLLLVMDKSNYDNVLQLTSNPADVQKVFFLRQFDAQLQNLDPIKDYSKLEVPDPYYEPISAYQDVLAMVESSITGLISAINRGN